MKLRLWIVCFHSEFVSFDLKEVILPVILLAAMSPQTWKASSEQPAWWFSDVRQGWFPRNPGQGRRDQALAAAGWGSNHFRRPRVCASNTRPLPMMIIWLSLISSPCKTWRVIKRESATHLKWWLKILTTPTLYHCFASLVKQKYRVRNRDYCTIIMFCTEYI